MDTISSKNSWVGVMFVEQSQIRHVPLPTAHLVMLVLTWMWSFILSLAVGRYVAFGTTMLSHELVLAGLFVTLAVFLGASDQIPLN